MEAPSGYSAASSGLGANGYGEHSPAGYSMMAAFVTEIVLTVFLVLPFWDLLMTRLPWFCRTCHRIGPDVDSSRRYPYYQYIGEPGPEHRACFFVGGWALSQLWLFIVAPLMGAALAAGAYGAIRLTSVEIRPRKLREGRATQNRRNIA